MTFETYLRQQADKSQYGVTVIQTQIALDIADWIERKRNDEPSIDAVKHGRWKYISFLTVECSECKAQIHDLEYSNFCPNCGAKMDETVDE